MSVVYSKDGDAVKFQHERDAEVTYEYDKSYSGQGRTGASLMAHFSKSVLFGGLSILLGFFLIALLYRKSLGLPFFGFSDFLKSLDNTEFTSWVQIGIDRIKDYEEYRNSTWPVFSDSNCLSQIVTAISNGVTWIGKTFLKMFQFFGSFFAVAYQFISTIFFKGGANGFNYARDSVWQMWIS